MADVRGGSRVKADQHEPADRGSDRRRRGDHDRDDVHAPLPEGASRRDPLSGGALVHGSEIAFYALAAVALVGAMLALLMIESRRPVAQEAEAPAEDELTLEAA